MICFLKLCVFVKWTPALILIVLKTNHLMHDLKEHFHEPESWTKVTPSYGKHMSWLPPITQFTLN